MSSQPNTPSERPDPIALAAAWAEIAEKIRSLEERNAGNPTSAGPMTPDPAELALLSRPFQTYLERISQEPDRMFTSQVQAWHDSMTAWQYLGARAMGLNVDPLVTPAPSDRRFRDAAWSEIPWFDFLKQSYLLSVQRMRAALPPQKGPDDKEGQQLAFYAEQYFDAISPTNNALTNPAVIRETLNSGGMNLVRGFKNFLDDLERGGGQLRISMTDPDKFEVGKNVGTTPGKVVFENSLIQLIQYDPTTNTVHERPLVIFPPWINKFYILDLQPENSFIKWAVDQGHTVFVVSWVNPSRELADKSFDDYLLEGSLAAISAAQRATGGAPVNLIGYCLGGTLLATTLAYLARHGSNVVSSATYFASLVDFSKPGDLGVFIDEEHLALVDAKMEEAGYLDGASMAGAFNSLRSNDLIWSFVVHNYLLGKDPVPFDLLYWNSDSTRMPRAMHSYYLRQMYLENRLREPEGLTLANTPIDLRSIETPTYIVSTKEDHIAPWTSAYAATQLYSGPVRFVLGGSGHIAGIINPPANNKYGYWENSALPDDPDEWLSMATEHQGSWWQDWHRWVEPYIGPSVPARTPGDGELSVIEDAPGRYVTARD